MGCTDSKPKKTISTNKSGAIKTYDPPPNRQPSLQVSPARPVISSIVEPPKQDIVTIENPQTNNIPSIMVIGTNDSPASKLVTEDVSRLPLQKKQSLSAIVNVDNSPPPAMKDRRPDDDLAQTQQKNALFSVTIPPVIKQPEYDSKLLEQANIRTDFIRPDLINERKPVGQVTVMSNIPTEQMQKSMQLRDFSKYSWAQNVLDEEYTEVSRPKIHLPPIQVTLG